MKFRHSYGLVAEVMYQTSRYRAYMGVEPKYLLIGGNLAEDLEREVSELRAYRHEADNVLPMRSGALILLNGLNVINVRGSEDILRVA